jgi:acyl-CoA thioesterase
MNALMNAQEIAEKSAQAMYAKDVAAKALGITLTQVAPGVATMQMPVRADMLNGHGICHGGLIFTLADTAFAYACNSYNKVTVAAGCSIEFLKAGQSSDTLVAQAKEQVLQGRHGIYDITVRNGAGEVIAVFRGKSTQIAGTVFSE